MAQQRTYLAAADVLRVAAIGLVGWYHIWQQSWLNPGFAVGSHYVNLQQIVRNGYMMVDVLLVLSGFLLALPHAGAGQGLGGAPAPREFYKNRFWRVVPSYALAILLCLFCWALPQGLYSSAGFLVKDVLAHFTFTHNLFPDLYAATPLPGVLWTMGVEVQFYLIFPLLAVFYERRPGLTCLALTAAALGFRLWAARQASTWFWVNQLPCMLDLYACGMGAAWGYVRLSRKALRPGPRRALALGAAACFCVILGIVYAQPIGDAELVRHGQLVRRLPLGLAAGLFLLCGCLAPQGVNRVLGNPVTRFLSAISYNFYIWHQFIAVRLKDWHIPAYTSELPNMAGEQPWQTRYTLLCFLTALAAAAALTYLWERPLARRAHKKADDDPPSPSPLL